MANDLTFEQWQATRKWCNDLGETDREWIGNMPGFIYEPLGVIEAPAGGAMPNTYNVVIANTERDFDSLEAAERYLWEEFVRDEIAAGDVVP